MPQKNKSYFYSCLYGGPKFAGIGGFDTLSRICDAAFEKRPPQPCYLLMVLSKKRLSFFKKIPESRFQINITEIKTPQGLGERLNFFPDRGFRVDNDNLFVPYPTETS